MDGSEASCRPIAGSCAAFFMEENEQNALQTQSQQRYNKAYYSPLPLERGWG